MNNYVILLITEIIKPFLGDITLLSSWKGQKGLPVTVCIMSHSKYSRFLTSGHWYVTFNVLFVSSLHFRKFVYSLLVGWVLNLTI